MRRPALRRLELSSPQGRGRFARLGWYGAAIAGVAAITLLIASLQPHIAPARLQMSYLLLVLALAIGGGRGPATLASLLAFLVFDWFFVRPVGSLLATDPEEWFTLSLFLVVGISTGHLAASLKRSAAEAQRRSHEAETLYDLSTALLARPSLDEILSVAADRVVLTLGVSAAAIRILQPGGSLMLLASAGSSAQIGCDPEPQRLIAEVMNEASPIGSHPRMKQACLRDDEDSPALVGVHLPLLLSGSPLGVMTAYLAADGHSLDDGQLRLLRAFATQTALAVGRMQLIEEKKRAQVAEESNRLKSVLLASVSHDLRTPITTIKTVAAVLRSEVRPDGWIDATSSIESEADRLNHLVDNLLEMSRMQAGATPLRLVVENIEELVSDIGRRMTPLLNGRELLLSAAADLPMVRIDGPKIGRVLTNLLENAIKFSLPQSTIRVELSTDGRMLLLRVHNVGRSIPSSEQEQIFHKFHRVRQEGREIGGTGLGLAIAAGIVEAHGGRIWTHNQDDGVAFYVALPTTRAEETVSIESEVKQLA